MTTPSVVPTGFAADDTDYLKAKIDRSGAVRLVSGTVALTTATVGTDTVIGLHPFRKGASLGYGSRVHVTDIDSSTNVTMDIGYVYDDNVTYTNDEDAFVAASTAPQAGGMMEMTATAGMTFIADADGWFIAQPNQNPTTNGTITFNLSIAYDS